MPELSPAIATYIGFVDGTRPYRGQTLKDLLRCDSDAFAESLDWFDWLLPADTPTSPGSDAPALTTEEAAVLHGLPLMWDPEYGYSHANAKNAYHQFVGRHGWVVDHLGGFHERAPYPTPQMLSLRERLFDPGATWPVRALRFVQLASGEAGVEAWTRSRSTRSTWPTVSGAAGGEGIQRCRIRRPGTSLRPRSIDPASEQTPSTAAASAR